MWRYRNPVEISFGAGAFERLGAAVRGRPYALFVCAGNDGSGAVASIQRIARGYGLREVQPALIVRSDAVESRRSDCEELGTLMALGLSLGVF